MPRSLTEEKAIHILSRYRAKIEPGNKLVRDANFLGNKLNGVVDYLVRNHGWSRTTHQDVPKFTMCTQLDL